MSQSQNERLLAAAERVRDAVFVDTCTRDTDGDGDCGLNCRCADIQGKPPQARIKYRAPRPTTHPGLGPCYCGRSDCKADVRPLHKQIYDRPMGMTD